MRSGAEFRKMATATRNEIEQLCKNAEQDYEKYPDMPEEAADAIRMANGNANLLIKKRIDKFESLIKINLGEEPSTQKVTNDDLEGSWSLIEMQLPEIYSLYQEVEKHRMNGYTTLEEQKKEEPAPRTEPENNKPPQYTTPEVKRILANAQAQLKKLDEWAVKHKEWKEARAAKKANDM